MDTYAKKFVGSFQFCGKS